MVAVGAFAVVALVPQAYSEPYPRDVPGSAAVTVLVLVVVGAVEVALRVVVARPQPASTEHAVELDGALRSTALAEAANRFALHAHHLGVESSRALDYARNALAALHRV